MRFLTSLAWAALGLTATALPAAAGTLLVPQQFPTIQGALNAAKPYDTVLVSAKPKGGVYNEAVTISTPHVTLLGRSNPVIDGTGLGRLVQDPPFAPFTVYPNGVEIRADHVAVSGLTVQNFAASVLDGTGAGINVGTFVATGPYTGSESSSSDVAISGNTLKSNGNGLTIQGYTGHDPYLFYGQGTYLKGYQVFGNTLTGNSGSGAIINGASVLVTGNKITGNGGDGLDVTGLGVTVSGNESGGNGNDGMQIIDAAYTYNPAVNTPGSPNPAPIVASLNYVHDNGNVGIYVLGTEYVSGNAVTNNASYGLYLSYADFSTASANLITGSGQAGIYADYSAANYGADSGLKISLNQVSGGAGDGIFLDQIAGGVISLNNVVGNQGIGIHLSDYTSDYGYNDYAPTTVTQDRAMQNAVLDARDDAAATDVTYDGFYGYDGDGYALHNVWTKDVFGTTDPPGLGK